LVGSRDHVNGFHANANSVRYTDEDPSYDTNTPDEELTKSSRPLMNCDVQRIELKLEENPWSAPPVVDLPGVMRDTVLVRTQWLGPRRDVCRRDNVKKVLVGDERFMGKLKGIVQWLCDVRKIWAKGKFCDYV